MTDDELRKLLSETTPGPWMVGIDVDTYFDGDATNTSMAIGRADYDPVALAINEHPDEDCRKSDFELAMNARLIAAAPDLAAEVLQLRERAEAAEAKAEALGREVNIPRYGQPDFEWSVHKAVMRDLQGQLEAASERADALEAESARLREATEDLLIALSMGWEIDGAVEKARAALGDSHA